MEKTDPSILDLMTDEEIQEMCKSADVGLLLAPMKSRPEFYKKYTKRLGRLDKKSQLVQILLPKYAFDLYEKGDEAYKGALTLIARGFKENFSNVLQIKVEPSITIEDVSKFNAVQLGELYKKILSNSVTEISCELFLIFLKLNNIEIDETEKAQLRWEISKAIIIQNVEEKFEKEKADELKKREKELWIQFDQEKGKLEKVIKTKSKLLEDAQRQIDQLSSQVKKLSLEEGNEKQKLIDSWVKEAEARAFIKKQELELQLDNFHTSKKKKIEEDCEYQLRLKNQEIKKLINEIEATTNIKIQDMKFSFQQLLEKKNSLEVIIDELKVDELNRSNKINKLKKIEEEFYKNIEEHALQHRLNSVLFESNKSTQDLLEKDMHITIKNETASYHSQQDFSQEILKSEYIEKIDDFVEDLKDNIALNFSDSAEIAAIILAAILNNKAIIIEDSIADKLVESVSSLIDSHTPIVIEENGASASSITSLIKNLDERVMHVMGVLDNFNEATFAKICRECEEKYLFFSISDIKNITMFSKNLHNYAVVLDIENKLEFSESDNILVGSHNIDQYKISFDKKVCRTYFDKFFRSLVTNSLMSKKVSYDFSIMMQTYFYFMKNDGLGEILKNCILQCCNYEDNDKEKKSILVKAGVI